MTDIEPQVEKPLDDQKEAWKNGKVIDEANASPLASESTRNRLKYWLWVLVLLMVSGFFWQGVVKWQAYKAAKDAIKAAPVAPPETPKVDHIPDARKKVSTAKKATKKIADKTINTPAIPVVNYSLTTEKPSKPAEPVTQFDRDLLEFERKIP